MTQADSGRNSLRMSLDPGLSGHTCYRCRGKNSLRPIGSIEQGNGAGCTVYACRNCKDSDLVSEHPRTVDLGQLQRVRKHHMEECENCSPENGLCFLGQELVDTIQAMANR